jgi:hypothetical protein
MADLQGTWVSLSGSVPTLQELRAHKWDELQFRWMIKNLATALLESGVGIIHGCHPSYTPLVAEAASKMPGSSCQVRMLTIRSFYPTDDDWNRFVQKHSYAQVEPIGHANTPLQDALAELATGLSEPGQGFVCVGGRVESLRARKAQVEDEVDEALAHQCPIYLLGGCGGLSMTLFSRFVNELSVLKNGLDDDDNRRLAEADPWDAPGLVLKGLRESRSRGSIAAKPLRKRRP